MKLRYLLVIPAIAWLALVVGYFATGGTPVALPTLWFSISSLVFVGVPTLLVWAVIALVRRARAKDAREREMLDLMRQQAQRRG